MKIKTFAFAIALLMTVSVATGIVTFADTYLKLHMVKVGNTVIVKFDEE